MLIAKNNFRSVVWEGYDRIAYRYLSWNLEDVKGSPADDRFVPWLFDNFASGAVVLDLGCGNGTPRTQALATRFRVIGVDLSWVQLSLARAHVPEAVFIQADMMHLNIQPNSVDAVVAFYSIIHVPREDHPKLFRRIRKWLKPSGVFMAALGTEDTCAHFEEDWLGAPMCWSGYDAGTNRDLIRGAGFDLLQTDIVSQVEDGEDVDFLWILAKKNQHQ